MLARLAAYCRAMAASTGKNPVLAADCALWTQMAREIDTYLDGPAHEALPGL
ncbi:MAG: hypothetical protein ACOH10_07720 [Rhodoglobus sp.]